MSKRPTVSRRPSATGPRSFWRRPGHLLTAAAVGTVLVLVLSALGAPGLGVVRSAGGTVLGPLERFLAPDRSQERSTLIAERDRLRDQLREARNAAHDEAALGALLKAPSTAGARLVAAHVVGVGRPGAAGPERVTLDVGTRDGVSADLTVVAAGGLVGRVVTATPWTCDVALLGAPEVVVGARVGPDGRLGAITASGPRAPGPRASGQLTLELVGAGALTAGEQVVTLGSVDGHPFVAGVPIGTVAAVDAAHGRLTPTAAVTPAVDVGALDIVAVLLTSPRESVRPSVTGGNP